MRLGDWNLKESPDCPNFKSGRICYPNTTDISPEAVILHPDFKPKLIQHDIALVKLKEALNFNSSGRK